VYFSVITPLEKLLGSIPLKRCDMNEESSQFLIFRTRT
jgi:hypothetical protein